MSAAIEGGAARGRSTAGSAPDYVLVRGGGSLWAMAGSAVLAIEQHAGGTSLRLVGAGELAVDEVLGVVRGLGVHTLGEVVRACWSEPARGLAIHGGEPCVVIDPAHPPRALLGRVE